MRAQASTCWWMWALSICSMLPSSGRPGGFGRSAISRSAGARTELRTSAGVDIGALSVFGRDLVAHEAAVLAFPVALFLGVALVVLGLSLGQRDLGLDAAALVVEIEWHEREAFLLDLADQPLDLLLVHQELLGAVGFRLHMRRGAAQRVDAATDQIELTAPDDDVTVGQLHLAGANGLDLPAFQDHAGLVALLDVIVEPCTAVLGDGQRAHSYNFGIV